MYRGWPSGTKMPTSDIYNVLSPEQCEVLEEEDDEEDDDDDGDAYEYEDMDDGHFRTEGFRKNFMPFGTVKTKRKRGPRGAPRYNIHKDSSGHADTRF